MVHEETRATLAQQVTLETLVITALQVMLAQLVQLVQGVAARLQRQGPVLRLVVMPVLLGHPPGSLDAV